MSALSSEYETTQTDEDSVHGVISNINDTLLGCFSFLTWNIEGLYSKIFDNDFIQFVSENDFVCLTETFLIDELKSDTFIDHDIFHKPATKLSRQGRPSGGVICLTRKRFKPYIKEIKVDERNFVLLFIDKTLFNIDKDVLYVGAYVPPEGSQYYNVLNIENDGISLLENCLVDKVLLDYDMYIMVNGDLNSRTSNVSQPIMIESDYTDYVINRNEDLLKRNSQDKSINAFGKSLLCMCTALDLCIINGTCEGDRNGRFTYITDNGASVDDYFLISCTLYASLFDVCRLEIIDRLESKHLPVKMNIKFPKEKLAENNQINQEVKFEKYCWNNDNKEQFLENLTNDRCQTLLTDALNLVDIDLNEALEKFNEGIKEGAQCMKSVITLNGKRVQKWYDYECTVKKREVRKTFRKFKNELEKKDYIDQKEHSAATFEYNRNENERQGTETDRILSSARHNFCVSRREYKNLLVRKKEDYSKNIMDKLYAATDDPKEFWEIMHSIAPKKKNNQNNINEERWFNYFKALLDKEDRLAGNADTNIDAADEDDMVFNVPISSEEVQLALNELKAQKAAGPDMIIGEMLKFASNEIKPFMVRFLNKLFDRGYYPDNWTESIILPIYKKGDIDDPGNYRGISLCDISSKVYSKIINKRIQNWVDVNNITGEQQAGFKKGYSTIDHIFTLMTCVQKQFSNHRNRKLYVAFIDFEKCFDTINRNILWPILLKNGFKGKLFNCIRSMYAKVKAKVKLNGNTYTETINCTLGVKQGDICSPVLFSLYINELAIDIINNGRHGVILDAHEIFALLLADDIVLCAETVIGLQNQLNNLYRAASKLHLKVNLSKSNIIVFRKGGYLGARERWIFNDAVMPVVNAYKYLGVYFSTMLSFSATCKDVASKAKRALLYIIQRLRQHNNSSLNVFIKIFDAQVQPIMQYGSEIWGLDKAANECEKVHLYALKKFLNVDMKTPNDFVYTEMARYPITINSSVNCIRYWLKLLQMENHRLPKKAYSVLYQLDRKGKETWASKIRICLTQNGFGYVWIYQGVGNTKTFLRILKERLIDCKWQHVQAHLSESDRFTFYSLICPKERNLPRHLSIDIKRHLKSILTKFRFGVSNINVHCLRYKTYNQRQLLCPYCTNTEENELHFILCCPLYENARKQFIREKYYRTPNMFRLRILMCSQNEKTIADLCKFLYVAFKRREAFCS